MCVLNILRHVRLFHHHIRIKILYHVTLHTAGEILRSHIKGNPALIVTNDCVAPFYLLASRNIY